MDRLESSTLSRQTWDRLRIRHLYSWSRDRFGLPLWDSGRGAGIDLKTLILCGGTNGYSARHHNLGQIKVN